MSGIAAVLIVLSLVVGLALLVLCIGLGRRCLLPTWFGTWLGRMPGWRQRLACFLGALSALWTGIYFVALGLSSADGHAVWSLAPAYLAQSVMLASPLARGITTAIALFVGLVLAAVGLFLARGIFSPGGLLAKLEHMPAWLQRDTAFLTVVSVFYTGTYAIFVLIAQVLLSGARLALMH
jgi:hypothetical protein